MSFSSRRAVWCTLTRRDDDKRDRVIAYFSEKLSRAENDYTANDRELLELTYLFKRFRCYLEGASFEILTDNQVFSKPKLSRKEAKLLETLGNFVSFQFTWHRYRKLCKWSVLRSNSTSHEWKGNRGSCQEESSCEIDACVRDGWKEVGVRRKVMYP